MELSSLITEGTLPAGSFTDDILHVCVLRGHALQWSSLALQGVVTSMSHVEAFMTGIKIESSNQSPFGGPIKGSR